MIIRFSFILVS